MLHYYIYYRIAPHRTAEAEAACQQIQLELETRTGIRGRLLRKRDEPGLWMEIYENVPAANPFEAELAGSVTRAGFQRFLLEGSTRKTECFQG